MKIAWSHKSVRAFKRTLRKNPQLRPAIEQVLRQLAEDPFQPSLRTHKLKGDLANIGRVQLIMITEFYLSLFEIQMKRMPCYYST